MGVTSVVTTGAALMALVLGVAVPVMVKVLCTTEATKWALPEGAVAGKTAIVTGANSGLGRETAQVLAAGGAEVVMACRSADKCRAALEEIQQQHPAAKLSTGLLDLADETSVRRFAAEFLASHDRLDLLINNAAIMASACVRARYAPLSPKPARTHGDAQAGALAHSYAQQLRRQRNSPRLSGRAGRWRNSLRQTTWALSC